MEETAHIIKVETSRRGTAQEKEADSYVAIDLETTGLDPKHDKIIEIGAVLVIDGEIKETFSTFVNPRRELDGRIRELTGITGEMTAGAPDIGDVIGRVVEFCRDLPLLGHHIIFDYSFLKRAAVNKGLVFEKSGIDTLTIFVHQDEFEEKEQKVIAGIHRAVEPDLVELESDLALIAVVGRGMKATRGTSGRIFSALAHANVNVKMIDQGSSELNIIIGVRNHDFDAAIRAIYDIFVTTQI